MPIVSAALGTIPHRLGKEAGGVENQRTSRDHPNCNIVDNVQNTEKNPGDLRRHAIIQTPVRKRQLTLK